MPEQLFVPTFQRNSVRPQPGPGPVIRGDLIRPTRPMNKGERTMNYTCSKNFNSQKTRRSRLRITFVSLAALSILALAATTAFMSPGAIYTTDSTCTGVNVNIFGNKDDVYLNGGPAGGGPGLPTGNYYVRVTQPGGLVLGYTPTASAVVNASGNFAQCYQLSAILVKTTDATPGYDTTGNPGGEYTVDVSMDPNFGGGTVKSDNFKVIPNEGGGGTPQGTLNIIKFYDANANGLNDDGQLITGWRMRIQDEIDYIRFTPVSIIVAPDNYTVTESDPIETNWIHTTTNPVSLPLADGQTANVEFGNLCLGAGGGKTLGFWSNKNGEAKMKDAPNNFDPEFTLLGNLCLRTQTGADFNPTTYANFRTWLLNANATNMAYMLSAQLAAMELNVEAGYVTGSSLVYAPCLKGTVANVNSLGFITIDDLMTAANNALCANGNTNFASADRTYQECLKNTLDSANNNLNFVQSTPCPFSFAEQQ